MRNFAFACLAVLATACASSPTLAQSATAPAPYTLADLPYTYEALSGAIGAQTMEIHHSRHHRAYVTNLNAALADRADFAAQSLETLLARASTLPAAVRNNGGSHNNHSLFWTLMAPAGAGGEPSAALSAQIARDFGSLDAFKAEFNRAATGQWIIRQWMSRDYRVSRSSLSMCGSTLITCATKTAAPNI